eukprot:TRINITY_DN47545_c0_g1_i1.p1 TRINITY_DN47545_c0_g1~~TRINITY_DN47545_c0_g1_i1.p1  ORF type:complete len:329 (+),score=39.10 TRINITY_DN47545_c0_g1_i1:79-1065(+)
MARGKTAFSQSKRPLRLALWQGAVHLPAEAKKKASATAIDACLRELGAQARKAKRRGAHLVMAPELAVPGMHNLVVKDLPESRIIEEGVSAICAREKVAMCIGFAEKDTSKKRGSPAVWNTALLVDATGAIVLKHHKHHSWGDDSLGFSLSREALKTGTITLGGISVRVGMLVCYDVEFPEMCQILAKAPLSAELILVPTALPATETAVATKMIPTRALENRIFIAYCNYPSSPRVLGSMFCGHSCVAGPDGEFVAGPQKATKEGLLYADIAWTESQKRLAAETSYFRDRLPAFYASQGLCQTTAESKKRQPLPSGLQSLAKRQKQKG